jgi:hypothetical protein
MKRLLLFLLALLPLRGFAETVLGTAITAVPVTISKPGVYHFTKDLGDAHTTGAAISITSPDVIIDLNAHSLVGTSGTTSFLIGINCLGEGRVTIKNGVIHGFRVGISLDSNGGTVSDLLVTNNFAVGIAATGDNIQVLRNRVCFTGGAPASATVYAVGISVSGTYGNVSDNDVQNTFVTDEASRYADGIRLKNCSHFVVSNNRVLDVEPAAPTAAASTCIATGSSDNLVILANTAITGQTGFDLSGGASGKYGDNITSDATTPYLTSGGGMTSFDTNN